MSTQKPDGDSSIRRPWTKKTESSYTVLGIVFLSLGVGLLFSDSTAWIPLAILGVTFLVVAIGLRSSGNNRERANHVPADRGHGFSMNRLRYLATSGVI